LVKWNIDKGKKPTGGRINLNRKRRKFQRMGLPLHTELDEMKTRKKRGRGGTEKVKLVSGNLINVVGKGDKIKRVKISDVKKNDANPHYVRRRIITKGTIVETEIGDVRVTSRPSQDGVLNGVLLEKKK
jgi:small subunit ribosomal protein S8e